MVWPGPKPAALLRQRIPLGSVRFVVRRILTAAYAPAMTLLMYCLTEDQISVVTDTLLSSPAGHVSHERKFRIHNRGSFIVAGMGLADVVLPWMNEVVGSCSSLADIERSSRVSLSARWRDLRSRIGLDEEIYATAYAFGFQEGISTRLQFSSRDGFVPAYEQRQGIAVRPQVPTHVMSGSGKPRSDEDEDLLAMAVDVTTFDRRQGGAVTIGGTALVARIDQSGGQVAYALGQLP